MMRPHTRALGIAFIAAGLALAGGPALAQQKSLKQQVVGTWTLVSFDTVEPNGTRHAALEGANPKGLYIFSESGRVSFQTIADIPKLASDDRLKTTADENKAVAHAALSYFGTYQINEADKSFMIHIERSSFPNQNGLDAKRIVSEISADAMTITNPGRLAGGQTVTVWKRAQ
jgi:hypothetical protein